jgi:hypothetical protein
MFISGFHHKPKFGDPFINGNIHLRIAQGKTAAAPIEVGSFHGNMTVSASCKAKTISLTREQVEKLIESLQDALNTVQ